MTISFRHLFQPIRKPGLIKLFLTALPLLAVILVVFINPAKIDSSDFFQIAWSPGRELLTTGTINATYPYPLWTVVVMMPFTIWSLHIGMVLWLMCNLLMLAASLALFIDLLDWKISPVFLVLCVFLSGFFLPILTSIWLGQLTIFSLLILALIAHLFHHQHWTWLGIVLGLSFISWEILILLAGLLLLWALWQRRWKILLGFGSVIGLLIIISLPFISFPGQLIGGGISGHLGTYIKVTSTLWGLFLSLGISWIVPLVISVALMIWLGWIWLPFLRGNSIPFSRMVFLFSAAVLVNLMVIPYSWMHNLALMLLPLGYCLAQSLKESGKRRYTWLILLFFISQPLMLGLFLALGGSDNNQAFQVIPALVLLPIMCILEYRSAKLKIEP